jgi:thiamine-monophosphate kinase
MDAGLGPGAEFDLIRRFLARPFAARQDVRVGPGDDAAVVAGDGIVLSSDLSVEGIHFRREWLTAREIGYRAAAAALSDLAAMAARPIGVLTSLAVPPSDAGDFAAAVMEGAREAAEAVGGAVLGGDLTRSPGPVILDVTVVGEAPAPVLRSGARAGMEVWVTGELGAPALCVAMLGRGEAPPSAARIRFATPRPRVREALWLAERGVPAAMLDLSDGLFGDASHIAAASDVAIVLEPGSVPIHPALAEAGVTGQEALALAMSGGEDYELCFCAEAGTGERVAGALLAEHGVALTRVGWVEGGGAGRVGVWCGGAGEGYVRADAGGFQHFGVSR